MRVIFMGSPDFALPSLRRLLADGHEVALVVTQPDRPAGRGQDLRPPAVKAAALAAGLSVIQPERVRAPGPVAALAAARPEAIVVAAYGQILPRAVLEIPPRGCVNVHASLLPKYRGAAPVAWALINGEAETGVTIMQMDEGMDTGPILLQRAVPIRPEETTGALTDRLAELGAEVLAEALRGIEAGTLRPVPQPATGATYAPKLRPEDARLSWAGDATRLCNLIRGLSPQPGATAECGGRPLKVLAAAVGDPDGRSAAPGTVLTIGPDGIEVAAGWGTVRLLRVQPANRRAMSAAEFARGVRLKPGACLGGG